MIKFEKGQKQPTRTPDSLTTNDTVEVLLALGVGPIKGLRNGPRDQFIDNTPLVSVEGESNFDQFALDFWPGEVTGHVVELALGGASSPVVVQQELNYNVPVTRQGLQTQINAIDVRLVVQRLLKSNDKGTFKNQLDVKIEIKKVSDTTWSPAWLSDPVVPGQINSSTGGGGQPDSWWGTSGNLLGRLIGGSDFDFSVDTGAGAPSGVPRQGAGQARKYIDTTDTTGIWSFRTSDQTWVRTPLVPGQVDAEGRRFFNTTTTPTSPAKGDLWMPSAGVLYVYNGVAFVTPGEYYDDPPVVTLNRTGIWSINEKTTSTTAKDLRIFVEAVNEPYQLRLTKLSPDSTDEAFTDVSWESIQEIVRGPIAFDSISTVRVLANASEQLTGVPNISGVYEGRIVKVPTNYDPVARTYTGVWDGTYKLAYTNNTAWVLQDYIENDDYGLSSIYPHTVNKWKFYEFGQWCDEPVARPGGGFRPRWTFNDYIVDQRDGLELAQYIAGSAGARVIDDGNGFVDLIIDRDDDPAVMLFTPENVSPEGFEYTYTDRFARANEVIVEFVSEQLNWGNDKRRIVDQGDIDTYGRITDNFIAVGCTDADEAMARGRRRLINGLTETEMVSFKTNRQGLYLNLWNTILVADPKMGRALTGRIRSQPSSTSVELRDPITLEPGFTYTIDFHGVEATVTGVSGNILSFTPAIPGLPEYANYSVSSGAVGYPKPYVVMAIEDEGGDGENLVITARELNRNKQTFIDTGTAVEPADYDQIDFLNVAPPTSATIVPSVSAGGWFLSVTWDASPSRGVRAYDVEHYVNDTLVNASTVSGLNFEVPNAEDASHLFVIKAVSALNVRSRPAAVGLNLVGVSRVVPAPTNFRVVGATLTSGVWQTDANDPVLEWDAVSFPSFSHYLLNGEDVGQALRFQDLFGTTRVKTHELKAVNLLGEQSAAVTLSVENKAPAAPTLTVTPTTTGINVRLSPSTDRDVTGAQVIVATSSGAAGTTFDVAQSAIDIPLPDTATRYVRAAYYDAFGKTGLNWSTEQTGAKQSVTEGDLDTTPPANITAAPVASAVAVIMPDGATVTDLSGSWNSAANAASYLVEFDDGVDTWSETYPSTSFKLKRVRSDRTHRFRVKGISRTATPAAAWSPWSNTVSATQDTTPPGVVGVVGVTALARRCIVAWTAPTASDLSHFQIGRTPFGAEPTSGQIVESNFRGTVFTDTNVTAGTTYHYFVRAVDRTGNVQPAWTYIGEGTPTFIRVIGGDISPTDTVLVTELGIAAGIDGQGSGATANTLAQLNPGEGSKFATIAPGAGTSLIIANYTGSITITGNTVHRHEPTVVGSEWATGTAISVEWLRGSAHVSARPYAAGHMIFGLTDAPGDGYWTNIDYGFYVAGAGTTVYIMESGVSAATVDPVYLSGDLVANHYQVVFDGSVVRYIVNGSTVREVASPTLDRNFRAMFCCATEGGGWRDIQYGMTHQRTRLGHNTYRGDGTTAVPQAELRTPEGIASGITGQSRFATAATLSLADSDIAAPWSALESRPALTQGNALTEDYAMADQSAWLLFGNAFFSPIDIGPYGSAIAVSNAYGGFIGARTVPVDREKTYMLEGWIYAYDHDWDGVTGSPDLATAYGGVDLQDVYGNQITGDGSYWLYEPAGTPIPNNVMTYYSRVFGKGTARPIPSNGQRMRVLGLGNYNNVPGVAHYFMGWRIVEVVRIGASLYRLDGTLATEPQVVTDQGIASGYSGQTAWGTYGDYTPAQIAPRVAAGLAADGRIAQTIPPLIRQLSDIPGYDELVVGDGSDYVGFDIYEPTSLPETVGTALRRFPVFPEQFGAVGDGVADDTAAIQEALDTGRDVCLQSGKIYKTTYGVTMATHYQCLFGRGEIRAVGSFNIITLTGAKRGMCVDVVVHAPDHTGGWALYVANAERVSIRAYLVNVWGCLYVEQNNLCSVEWLYASCRGPGIKWFGDATKRSDLLVLKEVWIGIYNTTSEVWGLDWDGNCHSLEIKAFAVVNAYGPTAMGGEGKGRGLICRNTSGGPPPLIARIGHLEFDYIYGDGIVFDAPAHDVDLMMPYIHSPLGGACIKINAMDRSGDLRISGGYLGSFATYAIHNTTVHYVLMDGTTAIYNDAGGTAATSGLIRNQVPRTEWDDNFYAYISVGNPVLNFDANDNLLYVRSANRYEFQIGGGVKASVDSDGVKADKLRLDDDAYLSMSGGNPVLNFAPNDSLGFNRSANLLFLNVGGSGVMTAGADSLTHTVKVSAPKLEVDANFYANLSGGNPAINFDAGDFWTFNRSTNLLDLNIGGALSARFGETAAYVGGYLGLGVSLGYSGGGYSGVGYNILFTGTTGQHIVPLADTASWLEFSNGGMRLRGDAGTTAGRTATWTNIANFLPSGFNLYADGTSYLRGNASEGIITGLQLTAGYLRSMFTIRAEILTDAAQPYHAELFQAEGSSAYPISLRFHQGNRWYSRIEGVNGGFHFKEGVGDTYVDIQANRAIVGDAAHYLSVSGGYVYHQFDAGDALRYDRTGNYYEFLIGSAQKLSVDGDGAKAPGFRVDDEFRLYLDSGIAHFRFDAGDRLRYDRANNILAFQVADNTHWYCAPGFFDLTNSRLRQAPKTVASLPTGDLAGERNFVSDATSNTFGAAVVGGGSYAVPVWHDGTGWKVG